MDSAENLAWKQSAGQALYSVHHDLSFEFGLLFTDIRNSKIHPTP